MSLLPCPSCHRPDDLLDVSGRCTRCRGEWIAPPHVEAAAPGRIALLRRFIARGPPTERTCPACRSALKAYDVPGFQYEGDLLWGQEKARAEGTCIAEGCASCGGAWMEADQLERGGGRKSVASNLGRLAEGLA